MELDCFCYTERDISPVDFRKFVSDYHQPSFFRGIQSPAESIHVLPWQKRAGSVMIVGEERGTAAVLYSCTCPFCVCES